MANRIKIKKGLQIPLLGDAEEILRGSVTSEYVRICPEDFHGITPKLAVKIDDTVKAGTPLFFDKNYPGMFFASPVSGVVTNIERGVKRRILYIEVKADMLPLPPLPGIGLCYTPSEPRRRQDESYAVP